MAWYKTGTINITNGSVSVTGTGTAFLTGGRAGDMLIVAGTVYEIASINNDTSITLAKAYAGTTATGASNWSIAPSQSRTAEMNDSVAALLSTTALISASFTAAANSLSMTVPLTAASSFKVNGSTTFAPNELISIGSKPFALSNGVNYNQLYSGGTSGLVVSNAAGNKTITSISDTGDISATGNLQLGGLLRLQRSTGTLNLNIVQYWNGTGAPLSGPKGDILAIGNQGGDGLVLANGDVERLRLTTSGATVSGNLNVTGSTTFAPNQYIRIGGRLFAAGNGSSVNYLVSGGTGGVVVRNAADTASVASISDTGDIYAAGNITVAGGLEAQKIQTRSDTGNVSMVQGGPSTTGYFEFNNASGVRQGYMGFAQTGGTINLAAEGATGYRTTKNFIVDGRVGIGTTNPLFPLVVGAANGAGLEFTAAVSTNVAQIQAYNRTANGYINLITDAGYQNFRISGNDALIIDNARRVMMGTGNPGGGISNNTAFTVNAGAAIGSVIKSDSVSLTTLVVWNTAASGNNVWQEFYSEASPALRGSISYNRAGGSTAFNTTSDYRTKTLIGPVEDSGETIDAIEVHLGRMTGASLDRPMFVAHELAEIAPYAVTGEKDAEDEDGKPIYQQVDHSTLVPLLVAELQALRARLADLESRLGE